MSKASRDKGNRREREIASILPGAKKVSRAWQSGPDLEWLDRLVEVKARKDGWKLAYRWLEDVPILVTKADRREWLAMMRVSELLDIIEEAFAAGATTFLLDAEDPQWAEAKAKLKEKLNE